jgi:hypothetical protein
VATHSAPPHPIPSTQGSSLKLVPKLKRTENFDMTNPAFPTLDGASRSAADASLDFGRFRCGCVSGNC